MSTATGRFALISFAITRVRYWPPDSWRELLVSFSGSVMPPDLMYRRSKSVPGIVQHGFRLFAVGICKEKSRPIRGWQPTPEGSGTHWYSKDIR